MATRVARGFAFGLTWYTSTSDGKEELKRQAKRLKANVYAETAHEMSKMYGFGEVKKWQGVRAAAACVAESLPDGGLFIHRIGADGTSCLIAIDGERRVPVPGMDLFGQRGQMLARAREYLEANPNRTIKVYGDAQPEELEGVHELSLDRIAAETVVAGELKAVSPFDARYALPVLALCGLAAIWYSDELTDMVTPAPVKAAEPPEVLFRRQVDEAVGQVVKLNQFPSNVMAGFLPFLREVASEAAGWRIESLKCVDTECTAVWKRQPGATSEGLLRALNLSANDPSITFYEVDFMKRKLSFKKADTKKQLQLVPNGTFSETVGTWFQQLADRQLERPTMGTLSPLVPLVGGLPATGAVPQVGQYRFTVLFSEQDLQTVAQLPEMMTIESIELRRDGDTKMAVQFNGKYYAL